MAISDKTNISPVLPVGDSKDILLVDFYKYASG